MKMIFGLTIILAVFLAGSVSAANPGELKQDKAELKQTKNCLNKLNSLVDKWHQASLDGNDKKSRQLEHAIINTIVKDMNVTFQALEKSEKEKQRSQLAKGVKNCLDDEQDFVAQRILLNSKQVLLYRLKNSDSFSLKLLALTNYQELLKKEMGWAKVELAEDVREVKTKNR
jgi:hypothetical protein